MARSDTILQSARNVGAVTSLCIGGLTPWHLTKQRRPVARADIGQAHAGSDRSHHQRNGAHRAGSLSLAHLPDPGALRRAHRRVARCGSASSARLLLCFATAISYAELSKLYPGAGSSYFFAEQAFLSKTKAFKFARMAKFHHRLGQPPLLLGLPGLHGRRDRAHQRLPAEPVLPGHVQRRLQQPAVHGPVLHRVRVRCRLHRVPRRDRHDRRQHGDQHRSDHRAGGLHDHRHRLSDEPPRGIARRFNWSTALRSTSWSRRSRWSRTASPRSATTGRR